MKHLTAIASLFFVAILIISCGKERNQDDYTSEDFAILQEELTLPEVVNNYEFYLGEHFLPEGKTYPQINSIGLNEKYLINNKATLGRVLFYDKTLSKDGNVSCGSCHHSDKAFSDDGRFSEGVESTVTKRNTLALATTLSFKISYNPFDPSLSRSKFSWDDSAANLPQQIAQAFRAENEMNIDEDEIKNRINEAPYYKVLFEKAYGDNMVSGERIEEAITTFIDAISSTNSKFDEGLEAAQGFSVEPNFYNFTEEENRGKAIYNANCASCHTDKHNFTVKATANNGLDMIYEDKGVGGRINNPAKYGVFKVPFLRNVGLTAPYMHDGRFTTLEEVVDHYSDNIVNHENLSEELKDTNGQAKRLNLNDDDKSALVAYLHTLTDNTIASDTRFTNPFK